jgi:hypothetical protein
MVGEAELPATLATKLQGRVSAASVGALNICFSGESMPSAEVDRINLTTVTELMKLTKDDHVASSSGRWTPLQQVTRLRADWQRITRAVSVADMTA